jgi:hypothetical protein
MSEESRLKAEIIKGELRLLDLRIEQLKLKGVSSKEDYNNIMWLIKQRSDLRETLPVKKIGGGNGSSVYKRHIPKTCDDKGTWT